MSNVSENLFQAMDIIIAERLNGLNYDKTILCKIEDDSKKDKGEYTVTDGASTFIAISKDATYTKGSSVYVTVPTGDFNQQKLIVGRYIANNEQYATYQAPFELYLEITENLIEEAVSSSLLANGETEEKIIWTWRADQGSGLRGYSRLGFNAKFKSWLAAMEPIAGTYGVRIDITGTEKTTTEEPTISKSYKYFLTSDEFYGDPYNFDVFYKQEKVFDISKIAEITFMQITFYQSKGSFLDKDKELLPAVDDEGLALMDNIWISDVVLSVGYAVSDFSEDTVLLYTFDSETYAAESQTKIKPNGRPLNEKNLYARWLHFDDEGVCTAIDKEEEMEKYEENQNAKIHWYKHVLQDGVCDDLAGNFWQEVNDGQESKNLLYTFNPDITAATETYKVIIEMPSLSSVQIEIDDKTWAYYESWGLTAPTPEKIEEWRNGTDDVTDPDTKTTISRKKAIEKIDEYLLEMSTTLLSTVKYYESETFTFSNEAHVPDQATLELVQGLKIIVDAVGLQGNYCIYGQTNEILNSTEGHKTRTMEAIYESLITNDKRLDKASTIRWKIPAHGTMIYPPENGKEYIPMPDEYIVDGVVTIPENDENKLLYANREGYIGDTKYTFIDENGKLIPIEGYYIIERNGTEVYPEDADGDGVQDTTEQISVMQDFRIESYYTPQNTNNTVHCEIVKNGLTYKASSTMIFGPQGTNGTDSTLILKFKDDQAALDVNGEIEVEAHLYDYNNTEVQIDADSISWDWFATDDLVEKIGNTIWTERTVTATVTDAAGNTLTEERSITYPSIKIGWVEGTPLYNILQCNVKYGQATVGQQAKDGVDLENEDAPLEEHVKTLEVQLQAFTPIPFRDNRNLTWAEVPTRIVYDDQGKNPTYYKNAFAITTNSATEGYVSNAQIHFGDEDSNHIYYPKVKQRGADSSAPGWYLEPKVMYFSGLSEQVCLQVTVAFNDGNGVAYYNWYQPILIIQNRWPSAMMNAWDGSLTIDEKNGTILSTMVGAGKKEADNSFTGVLMGDIATGAGYDTKQLGVYGFNHGQQSFGFKDDGTAFIGKAGKGRIVFDGNSGTIASMSRSQNEKAGMLIDLDDGFIDILGVNDKDGVTGENGDTTSPTYTESGAHVRIDVKDPYLTITTAKADGHLVNGELQPSEIMHVGVGKYFLQSADYSATEKKGTHLNINKGQYTAYDPEGNGDYVKISSDGNPFLEVYNAEKEVSLLKVGNRTFHFQSPDFPQTSSAAKKGMKIDIINSTLTAYDKDADGSMVKITGNGSPFFQILDGSATTTNKNIIYASKGSFYAQSSGYSADNGGLKIDFTNGKMEGGNGDSTWNIQKNGKATFAHITATTGGKIGPFNINSAALYTGSSSLGGSGIYLGTSGFSVSNGQFQVNSSGVLQAKGGKIGPFNFDEDSFYTGSDSYGSAGIYMTSGGKMSLGSALKYDGSTLTLNSATIDDATITDATISGTLNSHPIAFEDVKVLQDIKIDVVYKSGGDYFITDIGYGEGDTGLFNVVTGISYKQTFIGFRRLEVTKTFFTYKSLVSKAEDAVSTGTPTESDDLCYVYAYPNWQKAKKI